MGWFGLMLYGKPLRFCLVGRVARGAKELTFLGKMTTVPNCVVGHFGHRRLLSASSESHNFLGFAQTATIVGTIAKNGLISLHDKVSIYSRDAGRFTMS